uniref:ARAD1A13684p n=1 Tax=Blastobotrys adeninivorans TaxID=409370 RepID=A0A060SXK4_BLAAD
MDILRFKYNGDEVALETWLVKMVPVARWSASARDTTVLIENGACVTDKVDSILRKCGVKGQRTIGVSGNYQITIQSAALFQGTQFLTSPLDDIMFDLVPFVDSVLPEDGQSVRGALSQLRQNPSMDIKAFTDLMMKAFRDQTIALGRLLQQLVSRSRCAFSIEQDGIAQQLVGPIERYCKKHGCGDAIPEWVQGRSSIYERTMDMSCEPAYHELTYPTFQGSATAMCKVCMSEPLSKGIFDILTSFSGTRFRLDVGLVVDIEANEAIDRIRLVLVDGTVDRLVELSHNRAVAAVARDKIENRLKLLKLLQRCVMQPGEIPRDCEDTVETYRPLQDSIEYTINELQNSRNTISGVPGISEVSEHECKEYIAEACEVLLNNSTVVELSKGTTGDTLKFPVEGFLGLKLGPENHVSLTTDDMWNIYGTIETAYRMRSFGLELIKLPISIILTRECVNPERYHSFVRSQGPDFDAVAFENGDSHHSGKGTLSMVLFTDEVVWHMALKYDSGLGHSKRIMMAAALQWVIDVSRDREFTYDLAGDLGTND